MKKFIFVLFVLFTIISPIYAETNELNEPAKIVLVPAPPLKEIMLYNNGILIYPIEHDKTDRCSYEIVTIVKENKLYVATSSMFYIWNQFNLIVEAGKTYYYKVTFRGVSKKGKRWSMEEITEKEAIELINK